jgi:ArsR family transcriptional regulator
MKNTVHLLKLLSDPARLRILMLVTKKELCVCQIMGVLGISQPLVSRNLTLLNAAGFLDERKEGKLVFYSLRRRLPAPHGRMVDLLKDLLKSDKILLSDLKSLRDCEEFQKRTGKCDMRTLSDFMGRKKGR